MKFVAIVFFCVCVLLVHDLYFGHNGVTEYKKISTQLEYAQQQSMQLQLRNQEVADQINDLKQGSVAVEELARSELGLIKPNERFYRVLATDEKIKSMSVSFR